MLESISLYFVALSAESRLKRCIIFKDRHKTVVQLILQRLTADLQIKVDNIGKADLTLTGKILIRVKNIVLVVDNDILTGGILSCHDTLCE